MEEIVDILDEDGNFKGISKTKNEVHTKGYWHRTVHIWIINEKNEILLQRRSNTKKQHPNIITLSCEGHVCSGESSLKGAIREIYEEIGLKIKDNELQYIRTIKRAENRAPMYYNNEFKDFYILRTDKNIEEMTYQKEEISEILFVTFEKLKQMLESDDVIIRDYSFKVLEDYLKFE